MHDDFLFPPRRRRRLGVVLVDADAYGVPAIATLRTVFPSTKVVALSKQPVRRAQLAKLGATALPASTSTAELAALVARLA